MNEDSIVIEVTADGEASMPGDPKQFGRTIGKLLRSRIDSATLLAICWAALAPRDVEPTPDHMRALTDFMSAHGVSDDEIMRAKLNLASALLGMRG